MEEIKGKTISGIKWTYLSTFLARGLQPVVLIILARLLAPADFGLAAMAVTVISLFTCFSDLGLKHALVQQKGDRDKIASMAFWILLSLGIFWFLLIWIIAPYASSYFKNQDVNPLLRTLGLIFIINSFSDVPLSILLRDLDFKALFYRQLIPQLFSGVISIILASLGYGAWALVIGTLAGGAGTSIVVWRMTHWRPEFYFDKSSFKIMIRFGLYMSIQSILGWMSVKIDHLFVGRFLGASSLGIYRMGFTYGYLPYQILGLPFLNVAYPIFCKISRNRNELREKYYLYIEWIAIGIIPAAIALLFVMPFAVPVLMGNKWLPSIPVLQLIALTSMFASMVGVNAEAYKAIGRPEINVKLFAVRVLVSVPFYYYAAQQSIVTLAVTHVGLTCTFAPINFFVCSKVLKIPYLSILKKISKGLLLGLVIFVAGLLYSTFIVDEIISSPVSNAFCLSLILLVCGLSSLFVIDRKIFTTLFELIKKTFFALIMSVYYNRTKAMKKTT